MFWTSSPPPKSISKIDTGGCNCCLLHHLLSQAVSTCRKAANGSVLSSFAWTLSNSRAADVDKVPFPSANGGGGQFWPGHGLDSGLDEDAGQKVYGRIVAAFEVLT